MPKIICTKCGITGFSKCPFCRSIFQDNERDASLSHVYKFDIINHNGHGTPTPDGTYKQFSLTIDQAFLYVPDGSGGNKSVDLCTKEELMLAAFRRLYNDLKSIHNSDGDTSVDPMTYPTPLQFVCHHTFDFAPGQESSIGCGHKASDLLTPDK